MKKLVLMALVMAFAAGAQASELWWTLAETVQIDGTPTEWSTARIVASDNGYNFGGTRLGDAWTYADINEWGYAFTDLGTDASTKSFYIELYNAQDERIGATYVSSTQGAMTYNDLKGSIYEGGMSMTASPYDASSSSSFTAANVVPEPTSGLLMLIGFAGLALRRKRA